MPKYLITISIDAFSEDNWSYAKSLPNFSYLIKNGSFSSELNSVFPTLTYVVHTTMVTGLYPNKHGIIHNNQLQPFVPEQQQKWYWYQREINAPTIYDLAKENNLKTAGLLWPVTGKSSIKYNLPEIAAIGNENQTIKVLKSGNPFYCIGLEFKYGKYRKGVMQPQLDDYTTLCAVDTIKNKRPNLLLMHLIDLDDTKHRFGTKGEEVKESLKRMDKRLGHIRDAISEAGIMEDTVLLILGDHGQFDVNYKVHLNNLLKEKGLIYEKDGKPQWRAYLQSTGGNAFLHIKEGDTEAESIALDILNKALSDEKFGIEAIYDRKTLASYNVHNSIKYVVEAKIGYSFDDSILEDITGNYIREVKSYATHGYSPHKPNYLCNFLVFGLGIKKDFNIGPMNMVDIAPTMAKILGLNFYNCDGRVISEIFT